MPQSYFQTFKRDDGKPVEVEYQMDGGTTAMIVDAWPDDDAYQELASRWNELYGKLCVLCRWWVEVQMTWACWRRARLTDAERERMEAWLDEHWEPPDESDYYEPELRGA